MFKCIIPLYNYFQYKTEKILCSQSKQRDGERNKTIFLRAASYEIFKGPLFEYNLIRIMQII